MNYEAILWYAIVLDWIVACIIGIFFIDWYRDYYNY